jgi:pantetheine-phosphate adenylyltransferase
MTKKAIYSLSADPITFGHINIVERAAESFDTVIVAIGDNPSKKYLLSKDERLQVAQDSLAHISNVEVLSFQGLLVDYAFVNGVDVIIRGLRNIEDFQYEQDLNGINNSIIKTIDTFYLLAKASTHHISSSAAKGIVKEHVFAHEYLPLPAKYILEKKINNQCFIGVTGLVGCGKSYVCEKLNEYVKMQPESSSFPLIHNIDIDTLAHKVYEEDNPLFRNIRHKINNEFGTLNRSEIGNIVFKDQDKLNTLNDIFKEPLDFLIRQATTGLEGIILLNGATIISETFLPICNNNIIFVAAPKDVRKSRCITHRKMTEDKFEQIDGVMVSEDIQMNLLNQHIQKKHFGSLVKIENINHLNFQDIYNNIKKTFN